MKTFIIMLSVLTLSFTAQVLVAQTATAPAPDQTQQSGQTAASPADSAKLDVTIDVDGIPVTAHFPTYPSGYPLDHPTNYSASVGFESTISPQNNIENYNMHLIDSKTLQSLSLAEPLSDAKAVVEALLTQIQTDYEITQNQAPAGLTPEASAANQYMWFTATASKLGMRMKPIQYLWRVLIVNGHAILVSREVGAGVAARDKVDPADPKAWDFLQSANVGGGGGQNSEMSPAQSRPGLPVKPVTK